MKVVKVGRYRPIHHHGPAPHGSESVSIDGARLRKVYASSPDLTRVAPYPPKSAMKRAATRLCLIPQGALPSAMPWPLPPLALARPVAAMPAAPICAVPDIEARRDWQTRVGWAGRFEKCPTDPPGKLKKPHHLGQGKFAKVVRMREIATGRMVAIKKFRDGRGNCHSAARSARNEFEVTQNLTCRHTVCPEAMALDPETNKAFLVFPCIDGVALSKMTADRFTQSDARQVLKDLLQATVDLVSQGVSHNDIHASNILVQNGRGYLIDFGLAQKNESDILWRRDMAKLRDAVLHCWPGGLSQEAHTFFKWWKDRIRDKPAVSIAEDALQHPYISP